MINGPPLIGSKDNLCAGLDVLRFIQRGTGIKYLLSDDQTLISEWSSLSRREYLHKQSIAVYSKLD